MAFDGLNELSKDLRRTRDDVDFALSRHHPSIPVVERVRDAIDADHPFKMEFKVPRDDSRVMLDLNFKLPAPTKGANSGAGINSNCEFFTMLKNVPDCATAITDTFSRTRPAYDGDYYNGNNWGLSDSGTHWLGSAVFTYVEDGRGIIGFTPDEAAWSGGWAQQQFATLPYDTTVDYMDITVDLQFSRNIGYTPGHEGDLDWSELARIFINDYGQFGPSTGKSVLEFWADGSIEFEDWGSGGFTSTSLSAIGIDVTQPFKVNFYQENVYPYTLECRIWTATGTKPTSPTLSFSADGYSNHGLTFDVYSPDPEAGTTFKMYVDNINIVGSSTCDYYPIALYDGFNRTVSGSWDSGLDGGYFVDYQKTGRGASASIDGSKAILTNALGGGTGNGVLNLGILQEFLWTFPIEFLGRFRIPNTTLSAFSMSMYSSMDDVVPWAYVVPSIHRWSSTQIEVSATIQYFLEGDDPNDTLRNDGVDVRKGDASWLGVDLYMRALITRGRVYIRCWKVGSSEPTTWDIDKSTTYVEALDPIDNNITNVRLGLTIGGDTNSGYIESYSFISGANNVPYTGTIEQSIYTLEYTPISGTVKVYDSTGTPIPAADWFEIDANTIQVNDSPTSNISICYNY